MRIAVAIANIIAYSARGAFNPFVVGPPPHVPPFTKAAFKRLSFGVIYGVRQVRACVEHRLNCLGSLLKKWFDGRIVRTAKSDHLCQSSMAAAPICAEN